MAKYGKITGLGYCSIDHLCIVPRIPHDEKVETISTLEQGGGPAATAICTAGRLGAKTRFIGTVGADSRGEFILDEMAKDGIDTSSIKIRLGAESPVSYCWIEKKTGSRSIAWTMGTTKVLLPEEVNETVVKDSDLLHLDGHHTQAAIHAAKVARESGTVICLDAGSLLLEIEQLMELTDIIIASEKFLQKFTGEADLKKALTVIYQKNTRFVAVTLGDKGSIGYDGKNFIEQKAYKVNVVDTTGAGDAFHGAFAFKYLNGGDWKKCLEFASAVAALKCTKLGGRTGIPTLSKIENWLKG